MISLLRLETKFIKGIGPTRAQLLEKELGIHNCYDLLHHFPNHYIDRSQTYPIRQLSGEMPSVQIRGSFVSFATQGVGAKTRLIGLFSDGTATLEVVWFNRLREIKDAYAIGNEYIIFGKPTQFNGRWSMVHPEVDPVNSVRATTGMRGVYPLTEKLRNRGISSRTLFTWIQTALSSIHQLVDPIPDDILRRNKLMGALDALRIVHNPTDNTQLQRARLRLKFEELFLLQLNIQRYSRRRKSSLVGHRFPHIGYYFNTFYSTQLPFELTGAQKRVIKEIRADMNSGRQMNRLLQGDVGSGKTLVALMCMLIALDNSTQACLMAPTEILATQHFETINALAAPIGINVKLLTGSTSKKQRELIESQLADGSLHILIGTHAVIEDRVKFNNLGFVVIDEQHRFGVMQRARLWTKNTTPPHVLVMTATPIPRTLAMTVYGDLDVSVIDELPPGRKPIVTLLRYEQMRDQVYSAIGQQLRQGRQAYIVYPLIKENEKLDLKSLEEGYEHVCDTFPHYNVAFVHGRMKQQQKDYQMNLFVTNQAQILVATTVIEVGVNVPNATTMVIENAERFGLSQLHQLRGRVGRGEGQSYCILMSKVKIAKETRQRLELMTATTDGFQIAEADLKMRGPGDIEGTMQSGIAFDLHIANLATDGSIIQLARNAADSILDHDPELTSPALQPAARLIAAIYNRTIDFSRIS
jgi:ATP-dependent DNA helicase RecG